MPKFTPAEDEKIKSYAETAWGKLKQTVPKVKFTKGKKAKSYIKDAEKMYLDTVEQLCKNGFPLEIETTPENIRLHTDEFWRPLGISCTAFISSKSFAYVVLQQANAEAPLPLYIAEKRQKNQQFQLDHCCRQNARHRIKKITEIYNLEIQALLGDAGIYTYKSPELEFIDFTRKPYKFSIMRQEPPTEHKSIREEFRSEVDFKPYAI